MAHAERVVAFPSGDLVSRVLYSRMLATVSENQRQALRVLTPSGPLINIPIVHYCALKQTRELLFTS
jgi:hypothetical protein